MRKVHVITKTLHWATALGAFCSAVGFLWAGLMWLAALEMACVVGLVVGFFSKSVHATRVSQLLLLLQTVVLGAIWPSAITIAALVVLPGIALVVRDAFKVLTPGWQLYLYSAAVIAALSLAAEGWLLATIQRG